MGLYNRRKVAAVRGNVMRFTAYGHSLVRNSFGAYGLVREERAHSGCQFCPLACLPCICASPCFFITTGLRKFISV